MVIGQLFQDDINRKINGVVKVDQDATDVLVQELDEYVITRDLKKHFITFFNNYGESFREGTADIGVWISGFFGSGKSHFLKMLSYLLANQEVQGVRTVERFRKKFEDDPATEPLPDKRTVKKYKVFPVSSHMCCWPLFMRQDRVCAFPSGSTHPDYAAPV